MTFEETKKAAQGYQVVPVYKKIMSDIKTPMEVLRILKGVSMSLPICEKV